MVVCGGFRSRRGPPSCSIQKFFPRDIAPTLAKLRSASDMKKPRPSPSTVVSRSGRFTDGPSQEVAQFSQSVSFDWRLWSHDLVGSMAHATMLEKIGILSSKECKDIIAGLKAIGMEIEAGRFQWKTELEDVHMNIEAELTARVPAAAKLHTARSRNDQVALDVRLWLRGEILRPDGTRVIAGELRGPVADAAAIGAALADQVLAKAGPGFFD